MAPKDVAWLPGGLRDGSGWPKTMVQEAAAAAASFRRGAHHDPFGLRTAVLGAERAAQ